MADAVDQSWGRVDPHRAAAAGVRLVAGYLSHDSSKNWTPEWVRAYHNAGIGVLLNWESQPGRPLEGAAAGQQDATDAVAQARALFAALGQPRSKVGIVFSCDRDVNPGQYPPIDSYYQATKAITHTAGLLNGAYGEADLIDHLHAAGLTDVEWQTLAWSNGRVSPQADLYQSSINNTIANSSVDLNQIMHPADLGAWWPAGSAEEAAVAGAHPISIPKPAQPPVEDGMYEILSIAGSRAVIAAGPGVWFHLEGTTTAQRTQQVSWAKSSTLWNGKTRTLRSNSDAQFWKNLYLSGKA